MKNLMIIVLGLMVSGIASANNLNVYNTVVDSAKVSKALAQFATEEDVYVRIESIETTGVMRCPGCFEVTLKLKASPKDGREILLLKDLVVRTRGTSGNKMEVVEVELENPQVD